MNVMNMEHGEIIIYKAENQKVEVRLDSETVWLTQRQMAEILDTSSDNISLHLKNIYADDELEINALPRIPRQFKKREIARFEDY